MIGVLLTCRTTGASGTIRASGINKSFTTDVSTWTPVLLTVDTTAAMDLDGVCFYANTSASGVVTLRDLSYEVCELSNL